MNPTDRALPFSRVLRFLVRVLLLSWAAFWAWFVVAVSLGEEPAPPLWIPLAWLVVLAALVTLGWRWPRVGGLVLIAAGVAAALGFRNPGAQALLAAPAVALGAGCLASARAARVFAGAAIVLLALALTGCLTPQDPADLPYETRTILRHEDGHLKRAFPLEETELEGLPCQRWVWWQPGGRLDNVELARDHAVQGHAFPAGTRVFFDPAGHLAHAWLSRDTVVDGWPCRGRWKIDTAFHPNGRVKAFFPPDTLEIDGVACVASVFHPVYLHPDGHLRRAKLAEDVTLDGQTFAEGETLELASRAVAR